MLQDDHANQFVARQAIDLLLSRYGQQGNLTNYVVVAGQGHIFNGGQKGISLGQVGYNTILIVEIANSDIQWAEPRDLTWDQLQFEADGAPPDAPNLVRKTAVVGGVTMDSP